MSTMYQQMDLDQNPIVALRGLRKHASGELQDYFDAFEDLYERKLWHQLTLKIEEFFSLPSSGQFQIPLFQNFISDWENKMNKLKLVTLGLTASKQFNDNNEALAFLTTLVERVSKPETQDVYVLAVMETAFKKLLLGDLEGTKKAIDESQKILDTFDSVETVIYASFYRVSADFHKAKGEYAGYYKNALLYLACIQLEDVPIKERIDRAYDLALCALLGDTIYNFGELLMHPILDSLSGTEHEWLRALLLAFNAGDYGRFEALQPYFAKQSLFTENFGHLLEKIRLMSLIEAVFRRSADNRTIPFTSIAAETRMRIDEVEVLIMKALCLKLIRGTIDQVDELVVVTWVQPRVLDTNQIDGMRRRLEDWDENVKRTARLVENETPELFVQ